MTKPSSTVLSTRTVSATALAVVITTAVALHVSPAAAFGRGDPAERFDRMLEMLDKDGNGEISLQEANDFRAGIFDRMDKDGDGAVTQAEAEEARRAWHEERARDRSEKHVGRMFKRSDANDDGRITRDDFMGGENRMFERFDADKDGNITRAEVVDAPRRK